MNKILKFLCLILLCHGIGYSQLLDETEVYSSSSSSGSICLKELYSSGDQRVCLNAPSTLSGDISLTLPSSLPAGTECLQLSATGVISTTGAACGGGGGATLPVTDSTSIAEGSIDDTKEVRFEVDGLTTATTRVLTVPDANITLAGINLAQTWTAVQTHSSDIDPSSTGIDLGNTGARWDLFAQSINVSTSLLPDTNEGADIGGVGNRIDDIHADDYHIDNDINPVTDSTSQLGTGTSDRFATVWTDDTRTEELFIQRQGQGSHDFIIKSTNSGAIWELQSSGSATLLSFTTLSSPDRLIVEGDIVPDTGATYDLGFNFGGEFGELHVDDIFADSDVDITGDLTVDGASQIGNSTSDHSTIYVGTSGNFYMRDTGGLSTAISCSGVADGWFAITSDNYLVFCEDSGTRYRVAGTSF